MHLCISSSILKCICMHNVKNSNQVQYSRTYLPYLSRRQCFYPRYLKAISVVKNAHCCSSFTWNQSPDPLAPSQYLNAGCIGSILHSRSVLGCFGHRTLWWTALTVRYLKSHHENKFKFDRSWTILPCSERTLWVLGRKTTFAKGATLLLCLHHNEKRCPSLVHTSHFSDIHLRHWTTRWICNVTIALRSLKPPHLCIWLLVCPVLTELGMTQEVTPRRGLKGGLGNLHMLSGLSISFIHFLKCQINSIHHTMNIT